MKIVAFVILLSGLTILATSLPLVFRKVPMNRLWGVRLPAAFESDQRWYKINAYGGRLLALWSLPVIATGLIGLFLSSELIGAYVWSAAAIVLLSVLAPCAQTCAWIHRSQSR